MGDSETKQRFASVSGEQFDQLLLEKDAKNTRKATEHAVRVFTAYLNEKKLSTDIKTYDAETLDTVLGKFYTEARSSKGELYKKATLTGIRHGLNRYLTDIDIINSPVFRKSNNAFKAMAVELKRQGLGSIEHHPPIDKADLEKLYTSLNTNDPESLQCKVFVDIMLHFGRRGRENIRELKTGDFVCTMDGEGWKYFYLNKDELTKNHQLDNNTAEGRMYEIKEDGDRCPVSSFNTYIQMLPPGCEFLFPKVRKLRNKEGYFFDNAPMGHNKLGGLMTRLSEKYGLSRKYTNHSLRATSVHILDSAHIPSRHIMTVTGHKSEQSLKTYTGYTDVNTKRHMSHTISRAIGLNVDQNEPCPTISKKQRCHENANTHSVENNELVYGNFDLNNVELQPLALSNSQMDTIMKECNFSDDDFNELAKELPLDNFGVVSTYNQVNNNTLNYTAGVPLPRSSVQGPFITGSNAQITINYNIFQGK